MSLRTNLLFAIASVLMLLGTVLSAGQNTPDWIAASNRYTNLLLNLQIKYHPELGSNQGLSEYDTQISQPTLANEDKERTETEAVLATLKDALGKETS